MMIHLKKTILLFFIIPFLSFSQTNLRFNYNSIASSKIFSFTFSKITKKGNEKGIGLKYNINSLKHPDDQGNVFYRRIYATKPLHHIGIEAFYHKRVLKNWKIVKPFLFYNIQFTYSTTRTRFFSPHSEHPDGYTLYREYILFRGPYSWLEQSIGFGYNVAINNDFFISSKIGFEVMFINGKDKLTGFSEKFTYEFGYLFSVGIGYKLKPRKKKTILIE